MRVSDQHYFDSLRRGLVSSSQTLQRVNLQLTSGRRLLSPSDDPVAAGLITRARAEVQRLADQQQALQAAADHAAAADSALAEIASSLRRGLNILQQGLSDTSPPEARAALANELASLLEHLSVEGNRSRLGRYLFAGTADTAPPLVQGGDGAWEYRGNDAPQLFPVAPGRAAPANLPGSDLFNFPREDGSRVLPEVDADLFLVLQEAVEQLRSGETESLRETSGRLELLYQNSVRQRGLLAASTVRLRAALESSRAAEVQTRAWLEDTEGTDVVAAVTEIKRLEVVYQAAMFALGKVSGLPSLFEMMR